MPKNAFVAHFKHARRLFGWYFDAFFHGKRPYLASESLQNRVKSAALHSLLSTTVFKAIPAFQASEQQSTHCYLALSYEKSRRSSRATLPPYHNTPHSVTGFLALSSAERTYLCVCVCVCHTFLHYLEFREVLNVSSRRSSLNS